MWNTAHHNGAFKENRPDEQAWWQMNMNIRRWNIQDSVKEYSAHGEPEGIKFLSKKTWESNYLVSLWSEAHWQDLRSRSQWGRNYIWNTHIRLLFCFVLFCWERIRLAFGMGNLHSGKMPHDDQIKIFILSWGKQGPYHSLGNRWCGMKVHCFNLHVAPSHTVSSVSPRVIRACPAGHPSPLSTGSLPTACPHGRMHNLMKEAQVLQALNTACQELGQGMNLSDAYPVESFVPISL